MKNIISMFIMCLVVICGACSNEDDYNNSSSSHETQNVELDGTLSENNPSDTVTINGVKIILSLSDIGVNDIIQTRAIVGSSDPQPRPGEIGPFYSQGSPKALSGSEFKNRKLLISGMTGITSGVYFGDVWETRNTIKLPENAYGARVAFPNPSGCKDYTNLSLGVNWNLTTIQNDQIVITWWFYTFVLNYNMAGQQIYEVAPIDGAKVKVPYFYMLP